MECCSFHSQGLTNIPFCVVVDILAREARSLEVSCSYEDIGETVEELSRELHKLSSSPKRYTEHKCSRKGLNGNVCRIYPSAWKDAASLVSFLFSWKVRLCSGDIGNLSSNLESKKNLPEEEIKSLLEKVLQWISMQDLCSCWLWLFNNSITIAMDLPAERREMNKVVHKNILQYFKNRKQVKLCPSVLREIQDVLLLGLTDVWSAIRLQSRATLSITLDHLSVDESLQLYFELVKVCQNPDHKWQTLAGAVEAITVFLQKFQKAGKISVEEEKSTETSSDTFLLFGETCLKSLPDLIKSTLPTFVYPLLSHPQLDVREGAIKAFSVFLLRSEFQECQQTFTRVLSSLALAMETKDSNLLPKIGNLDSCFSDPYLVQSLLGLGVFLVKNLPLELLLMEWSEVFRIFLAYLSHPACSVRQVASEIFKFLVSKDTTCPIVLKLVLQGLAADWAVDIGRLLTLETNCDTVENSQKSFTPAWEWKEGRLLAYELILHFILQNHLAYTFGPSSLQFSGLDGRESSCSQLQPQRRHSLVPSKSLQIAAGLGSEGRTTPIGLNTILRQESPRFKISKRQQSETSFNKTKTSFSGNFGTALKNSKQASEKRFLHSSVIQQNSDDLHPPNRQYQRRTSVSPNLSFRSPLFQAEDLSLLLLARHADGIFDLDKYLPYKLSGVMKLENPGYPNICSPRTSCYRNSETSAIKMESSWLKNIQCPPLISVIACILLQTVECLGDGQWELQRMSRQLLPLLVEVIMWLDVAVLSTFWSVYLKSVPSILCYGACLTLQLSLDKAEKLWQRHIQLASQYEISSSVKDIVIVIDECLEEHFSVLLDLLNRQEVDKLSIINIVTLLSVCCSKKLNNEASFKAVLTFLQRIFLTAHGSTKLARFVRAANSTATPFSLSTNRQMSLVGQFGSRPVHPFQVEKQVLMEFHESLPAVFQNCDFPVFLPIIPQLAYYLLTYIKVKDIWTSLLLCLSALTDKLPLFVPYAEMTEKVMAISGLAVMEESKLIFLKVLDALQLRMVLDSALNLLPFTKGEKPLVIILKATAARLKKIQNLEEILEERYGDDIEHPSSIHSVQEVKTVDRDGSETSEIGSQSSVSEEDSDWDSWSDDSNKEHLAVVEVIQYFLLGIKDLKLSEKYTSNLLCLEAVLNLLESWEKNILIQLVTES
ncbi:uncharacterized protein LOC143250806 isoform X2 [Tachypleus tridentatus]|uniref:uncharacterized protein LOC143250806 isoform X2 n=1 Tax=Tachypleus tridentatus TaxID=6853 RepID=UPI003FD49405